MRFSTFIATLISIAIAVAILESYSLATGSAGSSGYSMCIGVKGINIAMVPAGYQQLVFVSDVFNGFGVYKVVIKVVKSVNISIAYLDRSGLCRRITINASKGVYTYFLSVRGPIEIVGEFVWKRGAHEPSCRAVVEVKRVWIP